MALSQDLDDWDRAYLLVGKFMCFWAVVEGGVNDLIRAAMRLDLRQGAIITANIQMRDKLNIARTAVSVASKPDQWKAAADQVLKDLLPLATERNIVAHNMFGPEDDGGVCFLRVRAKGKFSMPVAVWTHEQFEEHFRAMALAREKLFQIQQDLSDLHLDLDQIQRDLEAETSGRPFGRGRRSAERRQAQANQRSLEPTLKSGGQKLSKPKAKAGKAPKRPPRKAKPT